VEDARIETEVMLARDESSKLAGRRRREHTDGRLGRLARRVVEGPLPGGRDEDTMAGARPLRRSARSRHVVVLRKNVGDSDMNDSAAAILDDGMLRRQPRYPAHCRGAGSFASLPYDSFAQCDSAGAALRDRRHEAASRIRTVAPNGGAVKSSGRMKASPNHVRQLLPTN